jgi:hypothetical protein
MMCLVAGSTAASTDLLAKVAVKVRSGESDGA